MLTKSPSQHWLIKNIHECSFIFTLQISLNFSWGQLQPRTQQRRKSCKIGFPTSWCRIKLLHGDWIKLTEYQPQSRKAGHCPMFTAKLQFPGISRNSHYLKQQSVWFLEARWHQKATVSTVWTAYLTPVCTKWIIALFFFPTFPISKEFLLFKLKKKKKKKKKPQIQSHEEKEILGSSIPDFSLVM